MILIVTRPDDLHTNLVVQELERRRQPYIRFEPIYYPRHIHLTLKSTSSIPGGHITGPGYDTDLKHITAVWYRRPLWPIAPETMSDDDQEFVRVESQQALLGLWHALQDRFWVNPYSSERAALSKAHQLTVARQVGLTVPHTIITQNPDEALQFFHECANGVIYKMLGNHVRRVNNQGYGIYTSRVDYSDFCRRLHTISTAPCLFQEHIAKQYELRITVMGDRIYAFKVDSQSVPQAADDWRRACKTPGLLRFEVADISVELSTHIRAFMRELNLVFGCFDFIVRPNGESVFLEINPAGQWYWLEEDTGQQLLSNFVDMLIAAEPLRVQ